MYQHLWTPDAPTGPCERDCAERYDWLKANVFSHYRRPFSVLDLGANACYFGRRITHDFPHATVINVERDPVMIESLKTWPLPMLGLHTEMSAAMLADLAGHEMFDVVLCLSVLHHLHSSTLPLAVQAVLSLGFESVIELPHEADRVACGGLAIQAAHEVLGWHRAVAGLRDETFWSCHTSEQKRPAFLFGNAGKAMRVSYSAGTPYRGDAPQVTWRGRTSPSRFDHHEREARDWMPGIKLDTLQHFGGVISGPQSMGDMLTPALQNVAGHGDVTAWNVIVNHREARVIDGFTHGDCRINDNDAKGLLVRSASQVRHLHPLDR